MPEFSKDNPFNYNYTIEELHTRHLGIPEKAAKTRIWEAYKWLAWEYGNFDKVKYEWGNQQLVAPNAMIKSLELQLASTKKDLDACRRKIGSGSVDSKTFPWAAIAVVGVVCLVFGAVVGAVAL